MKIRKASIKDVEGIHNLGKTIDEFSVSKDTVNFWPKNILQNCIKSKSDLLLVAEENEKIIGKTNSPAFFDRGIFDYLAMCKLAGIDAPKKLLQVARQTAYDFVFICKTIPDFSNRSNTGRSLNKKDSLRLAKFINEIYKSYSYKPIPVKIMSVSKRVKFILSRL